MKLKLWPLALILYRDLPQGRGGQAQGPVVSIAPKYAGDPGILAHELEHVAQWWRLGGPFLISLHSLLYLFSKRYRFRCEVRAYRIQLRHRPASFDPPRYRRLYGGFISTHYGLGVSAQKAMRALSSGGAP